MLHLVSDFIKKQLDDDKLAGEYHFPRNQLYQMYFVMSRLDAPRFCKLDFIVNFGVPQPAKAEVCELFQTGGGQAHAFSVFEKLDEVALLKIHKYLFWADKKLHSVFYIEDKDTISEDLLFDFRSEEDQQKFKQSEQLGNKKAN